MKVDELQKEGVKLTKNQKKKLKKKLKKANQVFHTTMFHINPNRHWREGQGPRVYANSIDRQPHGVPYDHDQ